MYIKYNVLSVYMFILKNTNYESVYVGDIMLVDLSVVWYDYKCVYIQQSIGQIICCIPLFSRSASLSTNSINTHIITRYLTHMYSIQYIFHSSKHTIATTMQLPLFSRSASLSTSSISSFVKSDCISLTVHYSMYIIYMFDYIIVLLRVV